MVKAIEPRDFGYEQARHLLWRAGFGGTPEQVRALADMGPEGAVDALLNVEDVPGFEDSEHRFDHNIIRPATDEERVRYQEAQRRRDEDALARFRLQRQQAQRRDRRQMREMQKWWLARMVSTPRPAQEKMALFWHGHFATSYRTIEDSWHMLMQNRMFRGQSLGNFGKMLFAIIRDPAMLAYLDNNDSRRGAPNENLARELMELFSLGVGNYTEQDIKEGARALTGYTFVDDEFRFMPDRHDGDPKRILGKYGNLDGDGFVKAILAKRACGEYLCRKLYRFFAGDLPPDAAFDERELDRETRGTLRGMQRRLLAERYEVKPVLRELFLSEHFYSDKVVGQQIKSPAVLVAGAIRSLRTPHRDFSVLLDAMDRMGQNLFFPPSVKGWDGGRAWVNTATLYVRQNIMVYLLTGRLPDRDEVPVDATKYDPGPLMATLRAGGAGGGGSGGGGASNDGTIDYLLRTTLGGVPRGPRQALGEFARAHAPDGLRDDHITALLLLITAMPEYQLT